MNGQKWMEENKVPFSLIAGSSVLLGALLQWLLAAGNFWLGFLAASVLFFLTGTILYLAWATVKGSRALAWMMFLAFFLRLAYGVFLAWGLPQFGYETATQQAGYVFEDAYRRDRHAWALAKSDESLIEAFRDISETDRYGGLLALSGFVYRYISPDIHRPTLMVVLTAGAMALSLPFLMAAIHNKLERKAALWAGWLFVLYPEGILLGASQMREPFMILFFVIMFWAVMRWLERDKKKLALAVFILSAGSLLLLSIRVGGPLIAVGLLLIWVFESSGIKKTWLQAAGWLVILLGFLITYWLVADWVGEVLHWDTLQTIIRSGRVQFHLETLPGWLHFPFVFIYGLFQPVLPAAIAAPAPIIWRSLAISRSLGWYVLFPVLVYAVVRVWCVKPIDKRRWLLVLLFLVWVWIFIASARAGGDQWDNPRYRTIFLPWMAILAGWAIHYAFEQKDRWFTRGLIIVGIFLAFFTQWYISRYYRFLPRFTLWVMVAFILVLSGGVILGGWLWDRKQKKPVLTGDDETI